MFSPLRSFQIGKLFGIPLRIDPSWILIFLLLTYQLATIIFPIELGLRFRRGLGVEMIALAVIASLLLFASVVAHELAHALIARTRGVQVLGITLFIFGGVAQIADEPDSPKSEFLIAVVGPLISFVIAIFAAGIWIWVQALDSIGILVQTPLQFRWMYISVIAFYLAQANLVLAVFNLLPGFPLDGGRLLRAVVWAILKNQKRATYIGMLSGRAIALLMGAAGVYFIFHGELEGGWLLVMAWFLWRAAGDAYHSMLARDLLKQIRVGEIMRAPVPRVSEVLSLRELSNSFSTWLRAPVLAIDLNGSAVGIIGIEQLKRVERTKWAGMRVRQAMVPLAGRPSVSPDDPALRALKLITEHQRDQVAVVEQDQVIGIVGREELARYLQMRGE